MIAPQRTARLRLWACAVPFVLGALSASAQPIDLLASPESVFLCLPGSVDVEIQVLSDATNDPVTLFVSNAPPGLITSFSSNPVNPQSTSTMTLTPDMSFVPPVEPPPALLVVTGVAPTATAYAVVEFLPADSTPPTTPSLLSPPDGTLNQPRHPVLTWGGDPLNPHSEVEIARDAGFTDVVYSAVVRGTTHTVQTLLDADTVHHWRVRRVNACGAGVDSTARSFRTAASSQSVSDMAVDFGDQPVGAGPGAARAVQITNPGDVELRLGALSLLGPSAGQFSVLLDTGESVLRSGESRDIVLEFSPTSIGPQTGMVAIPSDAAVGDVQIDLSGTGVESAAATVAPSMLDFGEWPVNTSFALVRNFVLVNSGESNVSFTDIRLEGAQAGEFLFPDPPDTSDLAPGEVRSVAVAFDPTSDGMKVADVAVEMMAGGNPISAQVALSGTGGGPLSPIGLTTAEIVRELLGQNTVDLDVDVNADADEDAADVVTNENAIGE